MGVWVRVCLYKACPCVCLYARWGDVYIGASLIHIQLHGDVYMYC